MTILVLALLAGVAGSAWAEEPQAPKLDRVTPPMAQPEVGPTARALPRIQVICIDHRARRCWSGERDEECAADGGEAFAQVPSDGDDPGALLRACWDALR